MNFREEFKAVGFFYILAFLATFSGSLMAVYWTLYFLGVGFTFYQIAILFAIIPFFGLISEIPTGAIADVFGRKFSVFFSFLIVGLTEIGVILSKGNFFSVLLFYAILGVAYTLSTGAWSAWFIDSAKHKKLGKYQHRLLSRQSVFLRVGGLFGPLAGGFLVIFGYVSAYWATAILSLVIAFYILIFGREEYFRKRTYIMPRQFRKTFEIGRNGVVYALKHPVLLILILAGAVMVFAFNLAWNPLQPYVIEQGFKASYLGWLLALSSAISIIITHFSERIQKFFGEARKVMFVFFLIGGLSIVAIYFFSYIPLIALLLLSSFVFSKAYPFEENLFHKFVPSKMRATIVSVDSFFMNIGFLSGSLAFGFLSDAFSPGVSILTGGIILTLTSFAFLFIKKQ